MACHLFAEGPLARTENTSGQQCRHGSPEPMSTKYRSMACILHVRNGPWRAFPPLHLALFASRTGLFPEERPSRRVFERRRHTHAAFAADPLASPRGRLLTGPTDRYAGSSNDNLQRRPPTPSPDPDERRTPQNARGYVTILEPRTPPSGGADAGTVRFRIPGGIPGPRPARGPGVAARMRQRLFPPLRRRRSQQFRCREMHGPQPSPALAGMPRCYRRLRPSLQRQIHEAQLGRRRLKTRPCGSDQQGPRPETGAGLRCKARAKACRKPEM